MSSGRRGFHRTKWILAFLSLVVAIGLAEGLLRFALFHTPVDLAAKDPTYYARSLDELWVYRYLFSAKKGWAVAPGQRDAGNDSRIEFYRKWAVSLVPDAELGYVRAPGVKVPCHETTRLATRGAHEYDLTGAKIVFLGDSFVESAACSNDTLPAKLERLTRIDTLNYGVGGYGVDQIYLYFKRIAPQYNRSDCLFLIGLIQDDLDRILLGVRTSPKPFFTIDNGRLVLHTSHIHPDTLNDFYQPPPERFYLYYFLRGRFGTPIYRSLMSATRDLRRQSVFALSKLMFEDMARTARQSDFKLAIVVFPTPGNSFDSDVKSEMAAQGIPVVDLQNCLRGRPDTDVYAELHPTSLGNDLLASCLASELGTLGLMPASRG